MINWKLVFSFIGTITVPLLYILNIDIVLKTPNTVNEPAQLAYIGIFLAILGVIIWILSYISLGNSFGVLPKKQKRVTRGLYKYTNHPMYLGIYLTFLGLSLANSSYPGLVFLNLVILPLLFTRAHFEEKSLIK